jgi:hypothetical protein
MAARLLALIAIFGPAVWAQVAQHSVEPELQRVVEQFVKAVDNGDVAAVPGAYSQEFLNVRVADDGGFARLSHAQILTLLKPPVAGGASGVQSVPTKETSFIMPR